jgi:hypothetical protein
VRSTFESNEPALIDPRVLIFLKTDIELISEFVTTISGFPSQSRSPIAECDGPAFTGKSTFGLNEVASITFVLGKPTIKGELE